MLLLAFYSTVLSSQQTLRPIVDEIECSMHKTNNNQLYFQTTQVANANIKPLPFLVLSSFTLSANKTSGFVTFNCQGRINSYPTSVFGSVADNSLSLGYYEIASIPHCTVVDVERNHRGTISGFLEEN